MLSENCPWETPPHFDCACISCGRYRKPKAATGIFETVEGALPMQLAASMSGSLTKPQQDNMTSAQGMDELKKRMSVSVTGKMAPSELSG